MPVEIYNTIDNIILLLVITVLLTWFEIVYILSIHSSYSTVAYVMMASGWKTSLVFELVTAVKEGVAVVIVVEIVVVSWCINVKNSWDWLTDYKRSTTIVAIFPPHNRQTSHMDTLHWCTHWCTELLVLSSSNNNDGFDYIGWLYYHSSTSLWMHLI